MNFSHASLRREMAPRENVRLRSSSNQLPARSVDAGVSGATLSAGIDNEGYEEESPEVNTRRVRRETPSLSATTVPPTVGISAVGDFRSEEEFGKSCGSFSSSRCSSELGIRLSNAADGGSFSRWRAVRRKNNAGIPWWFRSPKPIGKRRRHRRSSASDGRRRDLNLIHLSGAEEGGPTHLGQTTTGTRGHAAPQVDLSSHGTSGTTEVVSRRPPRSEVMTRGTTDVPPISEQRSGGRRSTQMDGLTHVDSTPRTDMLPDILNSHLPPPYSTLPPTERGSRRLPPPSHPPPPPPPHIVPPLCNPITPCPASPTRRSTRGCHPFPPRGRLRSSGRAGSLGGGGGHGSIEADEPKHCCGVMVTQTVSIRWFILMIAFVGLCCAIVGTVLGALKATGREHLTVSLLMIGVGIVLITVSGIAWRLTSHDAPSCRAMLGLQPTNQEPNRRFLPRVPPYGRPPHPYAAMLYPEFQYRPPPPSYQASMQEYRLRLLLLDRQHGAPSTSLSPVSPPPTYRSHASSTLHSNRLPLNFVERDYSRPPSYRSRASSVAVLRPNTDTMDSRQTLESRNTSESRHRQTDGSGTQPGTPSHSRNPSLTLSFLSHESLFAGSGHSRPVADVPVANEHINPALFTSPSAESRTSVVAGLSDDSPIANHHPSDQITPPSKWKPEDSVVMRKNPDINTVTIVQTTDSSQVVNQDTVIVSITGQHPRLVASENHEVQVLAQV